MRSSFSAAGSFAVVLGCVAALFAGCGTKDNNGFDDGGADDGGPGADVTTIPFDEGGILNNEGGAGDASNVLHCSSDLHSVLDANDQVVKTCPPDQGCGAGAQCVPACQAAQDNKSTIGCDYYSVAPDIISVGQGACFAAFIANTWNDPVTIAVESHSTREAIASRSGSVAASSVRGTGPEGWAIVMMSPVLDARCNLHHDARSRGRRHHARRDR